MGENKLPPSPGTCWRLCFLSLPISLSALWFILSCDPHGSALVEGYNCWLVCPLSNEGQQNLSLSCLLLCTSEVQSAPTASSIPKKNRLPSMLCCRGGHCQGAQEKERQKAWCHAVDWAFHRGKKYKGKIMLRPKVFTRYWVHFEKERGCKSCNPQMSVSILGFKL